MAFTVKINSVTVSKIFLLKFKNSMDQWAGSWEMGFRDAAGTFDIAVGHELTVDEDATRIFGGVVQKFERFGGRVFCRGLDFTSLLTKVYANEVFFAKTIDTIVTDIITTNASNVTLNNLYTTTTTTEETRLRNVQLFKALQELAQYDRASFFVDQDKDLHFDILGTVDSGITLEINSNILDDSYSIIDDKLNNKIRVTGGREDYTKTKSFAAAGAQTTQALTRKPVSMRVTVDGTEQVGFKEGMIATASFDYFFNTDNKLVTWNVAFSGGEAVVITYVHQVPVIVDSQDDGSIATHDTYQRVVFDETINTKSDAQDLVAKLLEKFAEPLTVGSVKTRFNSTPNLGEIVQVINANKNINDTFIIVGLDHELYGGFTSTTYHVATLSESLLEILASVISRVEALEELERGEVDTISLLRQFEDTVESDDDPPNNLTGKTRTINKTSTWYFATPHLFSEPIKFGGGSSKYGSQVFTNISE